MRYSLNLLFAFICFSSFAQNNNVKTQAEQMGKALLQKDYKTFVTFTYPKLLKQMGGEEKMSGSIAQQMKSMAMSGTKIVALNYGAPTPVIKAGKELQCTIPQQMIMMSGNNKIAAKTTLIAISEDKGKRWYFIDAGERDITAVRQQLPNISKSIVLPKPEQPQLIK